MHIDGATDSIEDERSFGTFYGEYALHTEQHGVVTAGQASEPEVQGVNIDVALSLDHGGPNRLIMMMVMVVMVVVVVVVVVMVMVVVMGMAMADV